MFIELNFAKILESTKIKYSYFYEISDNIDAKKIGDQIKEIVKKHKISNVKSEYWRAIGNAINHGSYPILCFVYISKHGQMICIITDSGTGFDYKSMVKKYRAGKIYYKLHGFGSKCFENNKHLQVDWQDEGKTIILYYNGK